MKFHLVASLTLLACAVAAASETGSSKSWHNGYEHGYKMALSGSMEMHYSSDHKPAHGAKPHYAYSFASDQWNDDGKVKTVTHVTRSRPMPYGAGNNLHGNNNVRVAVGHVGLPYSFGSHLNNGHNVKVALDHLASNLGVYGSNHNILGLNNVNSHVSHSSYHPHEMYSNPNNDFNHLAHMSLPGFNLGFTGNHPGSNSISSGYRHASRMLPVNHDSHASFNIGGADDWFGSTKSLSHVTHTGYHPRGFDAFGGGNSFGNVGFNAFCDTFNDDSLFTSLF